MGKDLLEYLRGHLSSQQPTVTHTTQPRIFCRIPATPEVFTVFKTDTAENILEGGWESLWPAKEPLSYRHTKTHLAFAKAHLDEEPYN